MTKVESYINYSKNILHNVFGYNLNNAKRFYGDEFNNFYTIYLSISSDIDMYTMYGITTLMSYWTKDNTFDTLNKWLKDIEGTLDYVKNKQSNSLNNLESFNKTDIIDNISVIYKVKLVPTLNNEKGTKLIHDSIAILQAKDLLGQTETEWQDAEIVTLMEVLNGR